MIKGVDDEIELIMRARTKGIDGRPPGRQGRTTVARRWVSTNGLDVDEGVTDETAQRGSTPPRSWSGRCVVDRCGVVGSPRADDDGGGGGGGGAISEASVSQASLAAAGVVTRSGDVGTRPGVGRVEGRTAATLGVRDGRVAADVSMGESCRKSAQLMGAPGVSG